jgi:hypothetical protein
LPATPLSSSPAAPLLPFFDDLADLAEDFELDLVELAINESDADKRAFDAK